MAAYGIARMFGLIKVVEAEGKIRITGIPADIMSRDINKVWKTSRINTYMFTELGANHLTFNSFFAIEVAFLMNDLLIQVQRQTSRSVLRKIIALMMSETWLKHTETPPAENILDFKYLSRLSWTAKPHQTDFLNAFNTNVPQLNLNGYLLASPPGTGKTFMDIALGVCLGEKAVVKIIISPKNALRLVWYKTISDPKESAFKTVPTAWYSDVPGDAPVNVEYAVFHYEALDRALVLGEKLSQAGVPFQVVLDESHNFNESVAQRTKSMIDLCRLPTAHYHVWASGSPIKALGTEAIPFIKCIDPLFTDDVAERFKKIFGGDAKRANEILQHRLNKLLFKVSKDLVISDKPIVIQHKIKLKNSERFTTPAVRAEMNAFIEMRLKFYQKDMDAHKELFAKCLATYERSIKSRVQQAEFDLYKKYVKEISAGYDSRTMGPLVQYCRNLEKTKIMPSLPADMRKKFKDSQSVIKYVSLKVQGEALGTILGKRRAECATELAQHCQLEDLIDDAAAKTIVFASYVSTVTDTIGYLKTKGLSPKGVYADTNSQLNEIIKDFEVNPATNPICATYKSLSTAVPLIMANQIVMLDQPVRQYMYEQTVARVARLGQTKQVYVHEVLLDTGTVGNVSTRANDIIEWSRDQVASILGDEFSGKDVEAVVESFSDLDNKVVKSAFSHPHQHVSAFGWSLEKLKTLMR